MKNLSAVFAALLLLTNLCRAETIPVLTKAGVINYTKAVNELGKSEEEKVKKYLADVGRIHNIQIILGEAAYLSKDIDITEAVVKSYKAGSSPQQLDLSFLKPNPVFAIINSEKVFNDSNMAKVMKNTLEGEFKERQNSIRNLAEGIKAAATSLESNLNITDEERLNRQRQLSYQDRELQKQFKVFTDNLNKRTYEERSKIAIEANVKLNEIAKKLGINLILQEAAFVMPEFDITDDVIALLNKDKNINDIQMRPSFSSPVKVVSIDAEVIFNDSNYGELMKQTLRNEFLEKQNKAKDEYEKNNLKKELDKRTLEERSKIAEKANEQIKMYAKNNGVGIVIQKTLYSDAKVNITSQIMTLINKDVAPPKMNQALQAGDSSNSSPISLDAARIKCLDLGFKDKTEAFGKCVLRLSK